MYNGKKIGIVIPAYNEEDLIDDTLNGMPSFADTIYVTDDCSLDNTAEIVKTFALRDKRIKLIQHNKNQGVGGAIASGFKDAIIEGMDIVVVMAGDNQMDSQYLPILLEPIINNIADFTKGNRLKPGYWKGMSFFRLIGNFILTFLNNLVSGYWHIKDPQNGYIAISTECLKKMDLDSLYKGYAFENDLMVKANVQHLRMKNVLIPALYGKEKSKIKYGKFIFKTSLFLIQSFFWRIWKKLIRTFHPIGVLYIFGMLSLLGGLISGIILSFTSLWPIVLLGSSLILLAFIADGLTGTLKK
ncbi:MAG TPA: glycosyltransferase [candidate division Zixibacteria bacterium]|nr:glycosyltransferase [candidate division Zixibacteria bacterium]